jgi:hypothetical protein
MAKTQKTRLEPKMSESSKDTSDRFNSPDQEQPPSGASGAQKGIKKPDTPDKPGRKGKYGFKPTVDKTVDQAIDQAVNEEAAHTEPEFDSALGSPNTLFARLPGFLKAVSSLKLTVVLFAISILLVFFGTLAQVNQGIWTVVDHYFRSWVVMIEFKIFFPPSWGVAPGWGFPFPAGWLVGTLLIINLLSAHMVRFKVTAKGARLAAGLVLIAAGIAVTATIIVTGIEQDSSNLGDGSRNWRIAYQLFYGQAASLILLAGCIFIFKKRGGIVLLHAGIILLMLSETITGLAAIEGSMVIMEGQTVNFVGESRRSELAIIDESDPKDDDVVVIPSSLLAPGKVIQHKDLPVDVEVMGFHVNSRRPVFMQDLQREEQQLSMQTRRFQEAIAQAKSMPLPPDVDRQDFEERLARLKDTLADMIKQRNKLNVQIKAARQGIANTPVNIGDGLTIWVEPQPEGAGVGESSNDAPLAYINFKKKGTDESLGIFLLSQHLEPMPQTIMVGSKNYKVNLRPRRIYKPYSITLNDFRHDLYPGTDTPKNFSSDVRLVDESRQVDRPVKIWMNNPLRYRNDTLYQASFLLGDKGTILQVVDNASWLIPYLALMIVATGLLAHFGMHLVRFLKWRF